MTEALDQTEDLNLEIARLRIEKQYLESRLQDAESRRTEIEYELNRVLDIITDNERKAIIVWRMAAMRLQATNDRLCEHVLLTTGLDPRLPHDRQGCRRDDALVPTLERRAEAWRSIAEVAVRAFEPETLNRLAKRAQEDDLHGVAADLRSLAEHQQNVRWAFETRNESEGPPHGA